MSTNNSKVIGVRLPMEQYLNVIATAAESKMTVSDFVLLKLYAPTDNSAQLLQEARQQIEQLAAQLTALKATNAKLQEATNTGQRNALQQQTQISDLSQQLAQERAGRIAGWRRLKDLRRALVQTHDESGAFGGMSEKYWAIVDEFAPPQE